MGCSRCGCGVDGDGFGVRVRVEGAGCAMACRVSRWRCAMVEGAGCAFTRRRGRPGAWWDLLWRFFDLSKSSGAPALPLGRDAALWSWRRICAGMPAVCTLHSTLECLPTLELRRGE
jgi:hypothetical protein